MEIKSLYFGIFNRNGEYFNHIAQTEDGKWYMFHIPKTRKLAKRDLHEISSTTAADYTECATELHSVVSSLEHTGMVFV